MTLLTEKQLLEKANQVCATESWQELGNDFPDKMRSISGMVNGDRWLVVEHEPFPGQDIPSGQFGYAGTVTLANGHVYSITYDVARAAYLRGKAFLDKQKLQNG